MIRKWIDKLFGSDISLREKLFRMIVFMGITAMVLAIVSNIVLQESVLILIPLLAGLGVLVLAFWINYRYHKMELSATLIVVIIDWIMFPIIYLTSGGIESGATVWFVLGIIFVFLLFKGRRMCIVLIITMGIFSATYAGGYLHPELIRPMASLRDVLLDSAMAVFLVSIAIGVLIKFQNKVYGQEREISERQKQELEEVNRSKNSFFANMSHEIRTPINTIIGLNEMTLREDISDEIMENSVNIQNASKMLLSLINDILDLSKIESGKMEIVPTQYETNTLFSELINIIWIRAHEKKLELKLDIDKNIPSMLYGDEVRLRQVLINLLTNAVKYTKEGSVTLAAACEKRGINEIELKISVSDTGIGIRKENVEQLFSSFRRVDEKKNRNIEGTGLGLSISKQLIELMGGKIKVDSIYTKGSTFTVTVNQKVVNEAPIGRMDILRKKKIYNGDQYKQSFEAPDGRILIVDDNEMNLLVASKLLRSTKVQVDTARSGKECLEMTKNKLYHVILMDHKMPEMDGVETLQRIRTQENGRCVDTPVIALTANAMSGSEMFYRECGFEGYLAKPVNGTLLEAAVLKHLPEDLIEFSTEKEEIDSEIRLVKRKEKRSIYVTADCVCDIPQKYIEEYEIGIMPYYVVTNEGQFRDVDEIQADSLLNYLKEENHQAHSHAAEEYERFYADALEIGEQVLHITISQSVRGGGHAAAKAAMKGFDHVTVFDSAHLSSGMGILVLAAAKMAKEHRSLDEITDQLKKMRNRISTSFIVPSIGSLYKNGLIGSRTAKLCTWLELHPVFCMKNYEMKCSTTEIGDVSRSYQNYIRYALRGRRHIDQRVVFITYAGCTLKQVHEFEREVARYVQFDHVILQQASATISCNCGLGAMGVIFLRKEN